jgi:hypothetical protein
MIYWFQIFLLIMQLVMLLWSYFSVVFIDPGSVPPNWRPTIDEEIGEEDPLVGSEFSNVQSDPSNQRIRYCRKCNQLKPPRCHHCSVCEFSGHKHFHCLYHQMRTRQHNFDPFRSDIRWAMCAEDGPPLCMGS